MKRWQWAGLTVAATLFLSGCEARIFRAETVIHDDGSLERAVYQPADETPDDVQQADLWQQITYSERADHDKFTGPISELPYAAKDKDHPYFAAWGTFASAEKLPRTFVRKTPGKLPDAELRVDYEREDLVLVVEHRWQETLSDIVTLDDMRAAREQLAEVMIPLARKTFQDALGDEYDVTLLVQWIENTGKPWLFELSDVIFENAARHEMPNWDENERFRTAVLEVCARYGLELRDDSGQPLEDEALRRTMQTYVRDVLAKGIRRRDGEPVSDETIEQVLGWLDMAEPGTETEHPTRFEEAGEKAVAELFGGPEAFEDAVKPLATRILGAYSDEILGPDRSFHYVLEMPGDIIETNGTLLSDRRVRWTFTGMQAYPFGHRMACRSLSVQRDLVRELCGADVLDDRAAALRFVNLVQSDDALREALAACVEQRSLQPLSDRLDAESTDGVTRLNESATEALLGLLKPK
ncbi:MAG: hypothetical protein DWQ37_06900 [Planctomycetota bacterium]|nr:MAG: hypothetical protein DWQ37_06900 [Planctomycetota bacterium]